MDDNAISYLALLTSLVSLVVSFLTLYRDRHEVAARAVPIEQSDGTFSLYVTVANHGRRLISIAHVVLERSGSPALFLNFGRNGQAKIEGGDSQTCAIAPNGLPLNWSNAEELRGIEVSVQDALGKKHRAKWEHTLTR